MTEKVMVHSFKDLAPCYSMQRRAQYEKCRRNGFTPETYLDLSNGLSKVIFGSFQGPVTLYLTLAKRATRSPISLSIRNSAPPMAGAPTISAAIGRLLVTGKVTSSLASTRSATISRVPLSSRLLEGPVRVIGLRVTYTPSLATSRPLTRS